MKNGYKKVDSHLVHQTCEEDVLICNGYIGLPSLINKELFDNQFSDKLNDEEREIFHFVYKEYQPTDFEQGVLSENMYILKSIYPEIPKHELNFSSQEIHDVLIENYIECGDKYIINNKVIDEHSERLLLKLMGKNDLIVVENERAALSQFFENNSLILSKKVYCATMYNDTNHPHYYKKEHEHVPGMMVIESVRQALYAYTYTFKRCDRGNVSISISLLNSHFYHYAQSNYPLKIVVEDNSASGDNNCRDLKLKARLFQRNCLVAEIFYVGSIMKLNAFKRMRLMGKDEEEYMFYPIKDNYDEVILISDNPSCVVTSKLKEISMRGMCLFISNRENFEINQKLKFVLNIKSNNKIIAACQLESIVDLDGGIELYIQFLDLSKQSIMMISDYIKNYTYINDKGLIL